MGWYHLRYKEYCRCYGQECGSDGVRQASLQSFRGAIMSRRPAERRTQHAVMATASEWARIRELAADTGMDISRYIVHRATVPDPLPDTRIGKTVMTFPATTTTVPGGGQTGLAWMATAGVAVALDERVSLDLAWRYTDLGEVRTPRGPGRVVWRDGSREPLPLDLAPTKARLKGHGIRLSLRYAF